MRAPPHTFWSVQSVASTAAMSAKIGAVIRCHGGDHRLSLTELHQPTVAAAIGAQPLSLVGRHPLEHLLQEPDGFAHGVGTASPQPAR